MKKMSRTILLVIAVAASLILPSAQALPLWELQGTKNRITLLGSVHFLRAADYPLPNKILAAYKNADVVIMEIDIGSINPLDMLTLQQELAVDPRGRSLEQIVGSRDYRRLKSLAANVDIDLDMMRGYEPWFASLQVTQLRLVQLGFDGSYGVDAQLAGMAASDSKPLRGLETLRQQLQFMDELPVAAQRTMLAETIESSRDMADELDDIIRAWRAGNSEALEELMLADLEDQPEVYDRVLVQRNRNWVRQIKELANDSEDYLIVVGTLHLVGDHSVLAMLNDAGIRNRQIR